MTFRYVYALNGEATNELYLQTKRIPKFRSCFNPATPNSRETTIVKHAPSIPQNCITGGDNGPNKQVSRFYDDVSRIHADVAMLPRSMIWVLVI
jgi:hypothetical protein